MNKPLDFEAAIRKLETEAGESAQQLDEVRQKIRELGTVPINWQAAQVFAAFDMPRHYSVSFACPACKAREVRTEWIGESSVAVCPQCNASYTVKVGKRKEL